MKVTSNLFSKILLFFLTNTFEHHYPVHPLPHAQEEYQRYNASYKNHHTNNKGGSLVKWCLNCEIISDPGVRPASSVVRAHHSECIITWRKIAIGNFIH